MQCYARAKKFFAKGSNFKSFAPVRVTYFSMALYVLYLPIKSTVAVVSASLAATTHPVVHQG